MKKLMALLMTLCLAITLFSGCGKDTKTGGTAETEFKEHFKYTINVTGAEKKLLGSYDYLCNKFNVEFEFIPMTYSDWAEKARIWMATGDMPDALWVDIQNYNYNEYLTWVEQGLIKELPDMTKYPNLSEKKSKLQSDKYFQVDGKNYAWLSPVLNYTPEYTSAYTFFYRKDWARKLGMEKEEYTWDEFLALAKAFVDNNLGANDSGGTIGVTGSVFPHFAGLMQISPYWEQYFLKDGKYVWGLGEPETLEGIKMAKRMYDEGILWKDQIMAKSQDGINKFQSGQAGIAFNQSQPNAIQKARKNMKELFPDLNVDEDVVPMYVKAPNGKMWGQESMDYWSINVFNTSMSDEKMDRLLRVYDWVCSDEGMEMAKYGLEGTDYTKEDGKIKLCDDFNDRQNPIIGNRVMVQSKLEYEKETIDENARKTGIEILERLRRDDCEIRKYDYDLYFFSAENKDKYGLFYEEGQEKIKQLIVSSTDLEKDWNEWKASVQPKIDLVLKELNDGLLNK